MTKALFWPGATPSWRRPGTRVPLQAPRAGLPLVPRQSERERESERESESSLTCDVGGYSFAFSCYLVVNRLICFPDIRGELLQVRCRKEVLCWYTSENLVFCVQCSHALLRGRTMCTRTFLTPPQSPITYGWPNCRGAQTAPYALGKKREKETVCFPVSQSWRKKRERYE